MSTYFITGANRGIGLELTKQAAANGHRVFAACRNPDGERDLWELQRDYAQLIKLVRYDVSQDNLHDVADHLGKEEPIDVLINNAGVLLDPEGNIKSADLAKIVEGFNVNTVGVLRVVRTLQPHLCLSKRPKIINISSAMGSISDNTSGGYYSYRLSKASLNMLTKSLSIELPEMTIISMHPGWVKTRMGGKNALIDTVESVTGMWAVINKLKSNDSGKFFNYKGHELGW